MNYDGTERSHCMCGARVYPDKSLVQHQAEAAIAAGYRKPCIVTTTEELDALPIGSIVLDHEGCLAQKFKRGWLVIVAEPDESAWLSDYMESVELPAEILLREGSK